MLTEGWDAAEADFQRFYSKNLGAEHGELGCRRLLVLLNGLPPDSATWRNEQPWLVGDHLIASLLEVTDMWFRQLAIGQGFKPADLGKQIEIPRPGDAEKPKETPIAVQNMRALLTEKGGAK